jgi:uncharacterized membrane protein YgcG
MSARHLARQRPRRILGVLAASGALCLAMASPAMAARTGDWTESRFLTNSDTSKPSPVNGVSYSTGNPTISGIFNYANEDHQPRDIAYIYLNYAAAASNHNPEACAVPPPELADLSTEAPSTVTPPDDSSAFAYFVSEPSFVCNGVYDIAAVAQLENVFNSVDDATHKLDLTGVKIAEPPPPVSAVSAAKSGEHDILITWNPPAAYASTTSVTTPKPASSSQSQQGQSAGGPPPDFLGYQVTRVDGTGAKTVVVTTAPNGTSYQDSAMPDNGAFSYQVASIRSGPDGQLSSAPVGSGAPIVIGTPPDTTPGQGGSDGSGGSGGSGGAGGGSGSGGSGTSRGATATTAHPAVIPGDSGDEGYSSDLPYEAEPGVATASSPGRSRNNSPAGAGLLVPFAVSSVLVMWAVHILYVTRQARMADAALLPIQFEHVEHGV